MKSKIDINEKDLMEFIPKLQNLFPKARKPNNYGVPTYSYRGNVTDIKKRLKEFLVIYTKIDGSTYSLNEIYEATERYVNRYKDDTTYMKLLPYFISKRGEDSQLANELENPSTDNSFSNNMTLI